MVRVFVSDLQGYLGSALRKRLAAEEDVQIVGTVANADDVPGKVTKAVEVRVGMRGCPSPAARVRQSPLSLV